MTRSVSCRVWLAGLLLLSAAIVPLTARAQAWPPEPGRGSFFLGYEYAKAHWTLFPENVEGQVFPPYVGGPDNKAFEGDHYDQIVTGDLEYGIRRGMAASVRLAWVSAKYGGLRPHRHQNGSVVEADDGSYHASFQDAEITLRQMVLSKPLVATPFVGYVFPVKVYAARGHAATGHHLREFRVGATLARTFRPLLPDAYGQITYTYSAAERQFDHSIHRNGVDMELGYFVMPRMTLRGAASWIRSSGGVDWYRRSPEFLRYTFVHDELANERSWRLAGGVSFALGSRYSLYAMGFGTTSGASTHAMNGIATGLGWGFSTPWASRGSTESGAEEGDKP